MLVTRTLWQHIKANTKFANTNVVQDCCLFCLFRKLYKYISMFLFNTIVFCLGCWRQLTTTDRVSRVRFVLLFTDLVNVRWWVSAATGCISCDTWQSYSSNRTSRWTLMRIISNRLAEVRVKKYTSKFNDVQRCINNEEHRNMSWNERRLFTITIDILFA